MGYHKRNRIYYNGVKGERIEVTRPVKKNSTFKSFQENHNNKKLTDLALAILFLFVGVSCILYILTS